MSEKKQVGKNLKKIWNDFQTINEQITKIAQNYKNVIETV